MQAVRFHDKRDIRVEEVTPPQQRLAPTGTRTIVLGIQNHTFELAEGTWDTRKEEFKNRVLKDLFKFAPSLRDGSKGFDLCDTGTHPGGGVIGAPGHNAAAAVLADLDGRTVEKSKATSRGKKGLLERATESGAALDLT